MTKFELERVASLANHPGFKALLTLLDEADALLLERLEKPDPKLDTENLNLWRASRRFKRLIEYQPQNLLHEFGGSAFEDLVS